MKLVIDIPDEKYEDIVLYTQYSTPVELTRFEEVVKNGTPLPKSHGRLIDADRLEQVQNERLQNDEIKIWELKQIVSALDAAETVVEADGGNI